MQPKNTMGIYIYTPKKAIEFQNLNGFSCQKHQHFYVWWLPECWAVPIVGCFVVFCGLFHCNVWKISWDFMWSVTQLPVDWFRTWWSMGTPSVSTNKWWPRVLNTADSWIFRAVIIFYCRPYIGYHSIRTMIEGTANLPIWTYHEISPWPINTCKHHF